MAARAVHITAGPEAEHTFDGEAGDMHSAGLPNSVSPVNGLLLHCGVPPLQSCTHTSIPLHGCTHVY